jgi:hypothetical protein
MHHEGHHLCKAHQDCFHHQGQEREVLVQEPHVALSCTTSGTIQIGRVSVDQEEEEHRNWRKNKASHAQKETIKMINTIRSKYDHLLTPPFLVKKDDLGVPTIECTINQRIFHKTFCNIGLGVNIMSKVIYKYLFGNEPLYPTYMQLQMVNQSI